MNCHFKKANFIHKICEFYLKNKHHKTFLNSKAAGKKKKAAGKEMGGGGS